MIGREMMWRRSAIVIVLVSALSVGAWLFLGSSRSAGTRTEAPTVAEKKQREAKAPEKDAPAAITLTAEQRLALGLKVEPVQPRVPEARLAVTGKIAANPDRTVVIAPRTPGRVVKVMARLGDTVDAGAPLALLDSVEAADTLGELAQSDSHLALVQARYEQEKQLYGAKLRVLEAARQQQSAEAALAELTKVELGRPKQEYISALAKLELAQAEYERQKLLVERKIGARKDLVRAEKELFSARSEMEAVAETIRLTARQELLAGETALHQARAQRDKVREKLRLLGFTDTMLAESVKRAPGQRSLTPLVAPFSGTVIERQVTEGQLVDPGSVPFRLADLSTVWALLDVPETDVVSVRSGQEVAIDTAREARNTFTGRVTYVGDLVEEQTRTVKIRVEVPNPGRRFKPGMFVTANIAIRRAGPAVIMVPKGALFFLDEGPVVFIEDQKGMLARPVEIGEEVGGSIVVRKGLTAGERIVTEGGFALKAQILKAKMGEE